MTPPSLTRALERWVDAARGRARMVLAASMFATVLAGAYTAEYLGINTDTADMISPELDWRRTYIDYKDAFPQYVDTLLVVVDAATPDLADEASARLAAALARDEARFEWVRRPGRGEFFRRHSLLYLDASELERLADYLARVQPFLATLASRPDLGGLSDLVGQAVDAREEGEVVDLAPLLSRLAEAVRAELDGRFYQLSWRELMLGEAVDPGERRAFVRAKPHLDYSELLPAGPAIERVRATARALELTPERGVRVRVTGGTAMSHEELESVVAGAEQAGALALVMVALVLVLGLRSLRMVAASLLTLLVGLVWTAAFATAAIGELNLISIAFAVLYIGLGIDYAIHFGLRYRELAGQGLGLAPALRASAGDVGASLALCAITTGIGFFAFVPTAFDGVSELGIISGTGMFISLFASLTVLPAAIAVLRPRPGAARVAGAVAGGPGRRSWSQRRPRLVLAGAGVLGVAALAALPQVRFDDNPLNLRDPDGEAIRTFRDLLADEDASPWRLHVLARGGKGAAELASRLERLGPVDGVVRLADHVPENQSEKLAIVDEIAFLVGPDLSGLTGQSTFGAPQRRRALARLRDHLVRLAATEPDSESARAASRLRAALDDLAAADPDDARLVALERSIVHALPAQLRLLDRALGAGPVSEGDLPGELVERWIAPDGRRRLEIAAAGDLEHDEALVEFVAAVRDVAPDATGTPVVHLESGRAVVGAFRQAFASALVLVALLLLAITRSVRDTALVLAPLLLAGVLTVGLAGAIGLSFNFANVIALPLLLGVGVDNGIHLVHRARVALPTGADLLHTSTARGVVVSSLTTMCGFGNLALSPHDGTASMGILLTMGLALTLACTLVVLPALLARADRVIGDA